MAHVNDLAVVETQMLGSILLVMVEGRVDGTTILQLRSSIATHGRLPHGFILDLCEVSYVSSIGLKLLLNLKKRAQEHGGAAVVVIGTNAPIKEILSISGFDQIIRTYDDTATAIASLGGDTGVQTAEDIRVSPLSHKQDIVLRTLRDNKWITAGIYGVILLASRFARDPHNILELVIGIGHLERVGVPVVETILMIAETGEQLSCRWSVRRWKQEYTRLSRKLGTSIPAADRPFDVDWIEEALRTRDDPLRHNTKILDTPRRVSQEGYFMRHCVANYMNSARKGDLACLSVVDSDGIRWTVTVRPASAENTSPNISDIRGRFNVVPDLAARERVAKILGSGFFPNEPASSNG